MKNCAKKTNEPAIFSERSDFTSRIHSSIHKIPAAEWNRCVGSDNPFARHEYLHALESSAVVSRQTGFEVNHITIEDQSGRIVAAAATYIKHNSDAEMGADMGWSMAHERMCGSYYPKLQVEIPFCSVPGNCFLVALDQNKELLYSLLLDCLKDIVRSNTLSSVHFSFLSQDEKEFLENQGLPISTGMQFRWEKKGRKDFDEYLSSLKNTKRHMIKRERQLLSQQNLDFQILGGESLDGDLIDKFHHLYVNTQDKYGAQDFLNVEFFQSIRRTMPEKLLLIAVKKDTTLIAGTLCFLGQETIFAQYWGCLDYIKYLHFETTFYKVFEYCFLHQQNSVHSGQGGQHKLKRGVLPLTTHHAHWFQNKEFESAIQVGIEKKSRSTVEELDRLLLESPFKKSI